MNLRPLHNKVVIEKIENNKTTESGIVLPRSDEPDRAKILAVGPEVDGVNVGDIVLVDWNAATKVQKYFIIPITSVVFVYGE